MQKSHRKFITPSSPEFVERQKLKAQLELEKTSQKNLESSSRFSFSCFFEKRSELTRSVFLKKLYCFISVLTDNRPKNGKRYPWYKIGVPLTNFQRTISVLVLFFLGAFSFFYANPSFFSSVEERDYQKIIYAHNALVSSYPNGGYQKFGVGKDPNDPESLRIMTGSPAGAILGDVLSLPSGGYILFSKGEGGDHIYMTIYGLSFNECVHLASTESFFDVFLDLRVNGELVPRPFTEDFAHKVCSAAQTVGISMTYHFI